MIDVSPNSVLLEVCSSENWDGLHKTWPFSLVNCLSNLIFLAAWTSCSQVKHYSPSIKLDTAKQEMCCKKTHWWLFHFCLPTWATLLALRRVEYQYMHTMSQDLNQVGWEQILLKWIFHRWRSHGFLWLACDRCQGYSWYLRDWPDHDLSRILDLK